MTLIFPKKLDDDFLYDPADFECNATKGLKFMFFYVKQHLVLNHNETFKNAVNFDYIVYSNKKGKMEIEGKELILLKGWNILMDYSRKEISNYERINLNDFPKELYTWYLF